MSLLSYSRHHVDAEVKLPSDTPKWLFTGFFGFPEQNLRYPSWLVDRDFNEILSDGEKSGGGVRA